MSLLQTEGENVNETSDWSDVRRNGVVLFAIIVYFFGAGVTVRMMPPRTAPAVCEGIRGMNVEACVNLRSKETAQYVFAAVIWPATLLFMSGMEAVEGSGSS